MGRWNALHKLSVLSQDLYSPVACCFLDAELQPGNGVGVPICGAAPRPSLSSMRRVLGLTKLHQYFNILCGSVTKLKGFATWGALLKKEGAQWLSVYL